MSSPVQTTSPEPAPVPKAGARTILLCTTRASFEREWTEALAEAELATRLTTPEALASEIEPGTAIVIDAGAGVFDEDELLTHLGLARALGVTIVAALGDKQSGIEDVVIDLCEGLVARSPADVARMRTVLARRTDPDRAKLFEYVTVSPKDGEILAIIGDGTAMLLARPVDERDDGSEVLTIELVDDASAAAIELGSGKTFMLRAEDVTRPNDPPASVPEAAASLLAVPAHKTNGTIDGAKLGLRIRELRLAAGLTQAELARRTGIHRPNIARVEAGRHTPSLETIARLASAIGVPATSVFIDEG